MGSVHLARGYGQFIDIGSTAIFLQQDPLAEKYYNLSPYAYCANNPVNFVDPDGRKLYFVTGVSEKFKRQFAATISYMNECGTAGDIARLESSDVVYYIGETDIKQEHWNHFNSQTKTIHWDPNRICQSNTGVQTSPATTLAHEASHAAKYDEVLNSGKTETMNQWNKSITYDVNNQYGSSEEERVITTTEQEAARKHGEIKSDQVTRTSHGGTIFPIPDEMSPRELSKKLYEHNKNL